MQTKILVTGSNGFLGHYLCQFLAEQNYLVLAQTRKAQTINHPNITNINFDLNDNLDSIDLNQVEVIIHCAVNRRHAQASQVRSLLPEPSSLKSVFCSLVAQR